MNIDAPKSIAPLLNKTRSSFRGAAQRRARNPYSRGLCSWVPGSRPAVGPRNDISQIAPRREPLEDRAFLGRTRFVPAADLVDRAQAETAHPRRRVHQAD